jgi:uncharacterized membrane protein
MPLSVRILILLAGFMLLVAVLELVRKKRLREELSIIWLFVSLIAASGSVIDLVIDPVSRRLNIGYPPALVFAMVMIVSLAALLYFSLVTSDLKTKVKELTQKVALLEFEMNEEKEESD